MNLREYFIGQQKVMKGQYEISRHLKTPSSLGNAREIFIKEFLKRHLSKWLYFSKGEVINRADDQNTVEQDLVIYRPDMPHFQVSKDSEIFFIEGVLATIEVKTKIDKRQLKRAMKSIAEIKSKPRMKHEDMFKRNNGISQDLRCIIFAYDGIKAQSLNKAFNEIIKEENIKSNETPDFICVLGKYVVIKNDGFFLNKSKFPKDSYVVRTSTDETLLNLFMYLNYIVGSFIGTLYELKNYLPDTGQQWNSK